MQELNESSMAENILGVVMLLTLLCIGSLFLIATLEVVL